MFSMSEMMNANKQQRSCPNMPFLRFVDAGLQSHPHFQCPSSQSRHCPSPGGFGFACNPHHRQQQCHIPELEQMAGLCAPLAHIVQNLMMKEKNKNVSTEEDSHCGRRHKTERACGKDDSNSKENDQSKEQSNLSHPTTMENLMHHAILAMNGLRETTSDSGKWQQQVDCRGFGPTDINVKINGQELLMKAFKKQESEDGVRTMSIKKTLPLPENIDKKQIKCKFSRNGFMIVEAPYLEVNKTSNDQINECVKELMAMVLPGLEQIVQTLHNVAGESEKENEAKKSDEIQKERANVELKEKEMDKKQPSEEKGVVSDVCQDGEIEEQDRVEPQSKSNGFIEVEKDAEDSSTTHEPIITFPGDRPKPKAEEDEEAVSNASEDSFVLLSQLEKDSGDARVENSDEISTILRREDEETSEDASNLNDTDTQPKATSLSHHALSENNECVLYRLEMPSYNPDSMKVTFDNAQRLLSISANKEKANSSRSAGTSDTITKTVAIDDDVDVNDIQCYFRDGTLAVTAPCKTNVRVIPINA